MTKVSEIARVERYVDHAIKDDDSVSHIVRTRYVVPPGTYEGPIEVDVDGPVEIIGAKVYIPEEDEP